MSFIIEVRDLVMQYPGAAEPAVRGISFGVLGGEVFGLLGPNGAGKTTILAILSCVLEPSRGEALIAGRSVRSDPLAVKRTVGIVPPDTALDPSLRARENLRFWGRRYGLGGQELKRRIEEGLEAAGLRDGADERVGEYTAVMKRRLNIAAALLHRPPVLLLDEPTVGLDVQSRRSLWNVVRSLNAQGMTVLHATRDAEETQELSQRIGLIDQGRLRALGTRDELVRLVGQYDEVELHLAAEAAPSQLLRALAAVDGVKQVNAQKQVVRLLAHDGKATLPGLIAAATCQGVRVMDVGISEPGLEAAFSHLTGRALAD